MKISLAFAVVLLAATPSLATFLRAAVGFRLGLGPHEFSRSYGWGGQGGQGGQGGRALGHGTGGNSIGFQGQANKHISLGKGFSHGLSIKAQPILPNLHGHGHGKGHGFNPFRLFGISVSLGGPKGGHGGGRGAGGSGGGIGGGYGGGKGWSQGGQGGGQGGSQGGQGGLTSGYGAGSGGYASGSGGYSSSAPIASYGLGGLSGGQTVSAAGYGSQGLGQGGQGGQGGQIGYGGSQGGSGPSGATGPSGNGAGWANNAIIGQFSEGQGKVVPAYALKTQTQPQQEYYYPTQAAEESKTQEGKAQAPQWHQAEKVKILYVPGQVSNDWVNQQNQQEQQQQASNQQSVVPMATSSQSQQTYQYTASNNLNNLNNLNLDSVQAGSQQQQQVQIASSRSDVDGASLPWTPIFTPTLEAATAEDNSEKSVVKRQLEEEEQFQLQQNQEISSQTEAV